MKQYIGDSVYVDFNGDYLILTTENGGRPSNTIVLDGDVWTALKKYVNEVTTE